MAPVLPVSTGNLPGSSVEKLRFFGSGFSRENMHGVPGGYTVRVEPENRVTISV